MTDGRNGTALAFSNVGHSYSHFLMLVYPTAVIALEDELGLPFHQLLGLMLVGNILFGAMALPAGYLGDRWSVPGMMIVFFLGTGAGAVLTGLASTPFEIALGLAAIGFFGAIYHPVGIAWIARRVVNRGKALGWNGLCGGLGVALAPLVAGVLSDLWSWRLAFILPGGICVLTGLLLIAAVSVGLVSDDRIQYRAARTEATRNDMQRGAMILLLTVGCTGLIYQATSFALPKLFDSRLSAELGGGLIGVGFLVSAIYLAASGTQIVGGWLADRFDVRRVYILSWALQVPLLLVAALVDGMVLVVVVVAMVVANSIGTPSENSLFARYTPPRWRATAFGVKFVLSLGVAAGAIPLIAWIYAATGGFVWLLVVLAAVAVLASAAAVLLPRNRPEGLETLAIQPQHAAE